MYQHLLSLAAFKGITTYELAGALAVLFTVIGGAWYVYKVITDPRKKPARSTWFIWTVGSSLLAWSYFDSNAHESGWMAVAIAVEYAAVAVLSIWYGVGGWESIDKWCFGGVLLSALLFLLAKDIPQIALCLLIVIDAIGAWPTLDKVKRRPRTEARGPWIFTVFGCIANMFAVNWTESGWSWNTFFIGLYPVSMLLVNGVVLAFILRPVWRRILRRARSA